MNVVAKFRCNGKADECVNLTVVTDDSPVNADFFKWTPSGTIQMGILNERALEQFEFGKEYLVTFEKV